jgi:group I intron endonuclease
MEEKLNSKCGVYLIVSPSNGRYVGSSKRLDKRFNRYKNLSCGKQTAIYSSLRKYGFENHKIKVLIYCNELDRLFWERVFGDIYLSSANFKNGLNIFLPGYDDVPPIVSDEHKLKISNLQKLRFSDPLERKRISEKTKRGFTDEVRKKMSEIHSKRCNTPEFKKARSEKQKKYFSSPEARIKISNSIKKFLSDNPDVKEKNYSALVKYYENNPEKRSLNAKNIHINNPNLGKEHGEKLKNTIKITLKQEKGQAKKQKFNFLTQVSIHYLKR